MGAASPISIGSTSPHTLSVIFKSDILKADWRQTEHQRYAKEMMLRFLKPEPS